MIDLLYVDLFCGAGGTSQGVESARIDEDKCAKVIACVNHDPNAIASHAANHPEALHFTEDIRTLNLSPLVKHIQKMRTMYPEAELVLWASLECTNFSKAKGGKPRDADSRTLAEHLYRYIEVIQPDYIQVENVEEFMSWGDLDKNGKPVSKDQGRCFIRWMNRICQQYGYTFDYRILNSANYGAYTSRKRLFIQFAANGLPIVWPTQTHAKNGNGGDLFHFYKKWKPVKEVLELDDEGTSIFARKKPLCEKTLERIYCGLIKFVAGGKDNFLVKWNSISNKTNFSYTVTDTNAPCPTVSCQNRLGVATVQFLSKAFSGDPYSKNKSIEEPADTVTAIDHHTFITAYYGTINNHSIDLPAPVVPTVDRFGLVNYNFLDMQYGNGSPSSTNLPSPTLLNNPKQKLVSVNQFLMNPQYNNTGSSIDNPCFTLIARMDKCPPYLITTETGSVGIAIFDTDSPMTIKIKEFMAMYNILDIKMRMLHISELKRIQGFTDSYILIGTSAEQKKFLGNAVEVNMSRVLCEALSAELQYRYQLAI